MSVIITIIMIACQPVSPTPTLSLTLHHLSCLLCPDPSTRLTSTNFFDSMPPPVLVSSLSSVLLQHSSPVDLKLLSLKLLELLYKRHETALNQRPLLELILTVYFQERDIRCLAVMKLAGMLLGRVGVEGQVEILTQVLKAAENNQRQKKSLEFLAELAEEFQNVVFPEQTEQYLKSLSLSDQANCTYVIRILVGLSKSYTKRQEELTFNQALSLYGKGKDTILKYLCYLMAKETVPVQYIQQCAEFICRCCFTPRSVQYEIETISCWSKLLALLIFVSTIHDSFQNPILSGAFFQQYLDWVVMVVTKHPDAALIRHEVVSHIGQLTVMGRGHLISTSINNLAIHALNHEDSIDDGALFVLGIFCKLEEFQNSSYLARMCIRRLANNKEKFGALVYLKGYFQGAGEVSQDIRDEIEATVVDVLSGELSEQEFQWALKLHVSSNCSPSSQTIMSVIAFIDGSDFQQIPKLNAIMLQQFSLLQFDHQCLGMLLGMVECNYAISSPHAKGQYLQILCIAMRKNGSIGLFIQIYTILKTIELNPQQVVIIDSYCEIWIELLKTFNKSVIADSNFTLDTWRLLEFFLKYETEDRVANFMMEMLLFNDETVRANLRDLLVENLPFTNLKFYDILQMFAVLYPRTLAVKTPQILERLSGRKQYYRLYFRLPPTQFLALPNQQFSNTQQLKWFLLSVLNFQGKLKNQQPLEKPNALDQLSVEFDRLALDHPLMEIAHKAYRTLEQAVSRVFYDGHWLLDWSGCSINKIINKDYAKFSKAKLLEMFRNSNSV